MSLFRTVTARMDASGTRRRRSVRARRLALVAGICVLVGFLVAAVWPTSWLLHNPYQNEPTARFLPPVFAGGRAAYPLGADALGRDIFGVMVAGSRFTLTIVLVSAVLGLVLGVTMGSLAGYYRGWVDLVVMRVVDIQLAFPALVLLIAVIAAVGPSLRNLILILGITAAAPYARLVRGLILSLRETEFVEAARASGSQSTRIILRHLLPNCRTQIVVYLTYDFARLVLMEASLAFLGFGVQPPIPSWGGLIADSREYMYQAPWASLVPGIAVVLVVLAFNFVGDELRDMADARA